jgi:hypothetical protein
MTRFLALHKDHCCLCPLGGAPSLTRGRVCHLSVVFVMIFMLCQNIYIGRWTNWCWDRLLSEFFGFPSALGYDRGSIPGGDERIFLLASVSRPALGSTQPPVQWVPGVLSAGVKRGRGVTLAIHHHLVPRSRMSRTYTSPPPQSVFVACSGTVLALG